MNHSLTTRRYRLIYSNLTVKKQTRGKILFNSDSKNSLEYFFFLIIREGLGVRVTSESILIMYQ